MWIIRYSHYTLYYYAYTFLIVFVSTVHDTDLLAHQGEVFILHKNYLDEKEKVIHIFTIDIDIRN